MDDDDFGLGPAEVYRPYDECQNMYFKLQILNYEDEFLKLSRLKPLHRLYFMMPTNSGEQYYNFVLLAAWLLIKCGQDDVELPQESDDPNTVISNLLANMRQMGGTIDFSPSKVKSGCGPEVVHVLGFLAEKAVATSGIEWKKPVLVVKSQEEQAAAAAAEEKLAQTFQELDIEKVEEEMGQYYTSDEEDIDNEPDLAWGTSNDDTKDKGTDNTKDKLKILESNTDAEEWRLELERVLPQLKVTVKPDTHDWRWRYEQMENYTKGISDALEQLENPLEKIVSEAKNVLEKVHTRESHLSSQVEGLLTQLSINQEKLTEKRTKHREQGIELGNRNKLLAKLTDDVEETRRQLDDRGTVMADGAPVNQVRKALGALRKEMADMEVEIGVMEHCVLKSLIQEQVLLRDKSNLA